MARLRPVAHALKDPHFSVLLRPIDAAWTHAGLTGTMAGFNPLRHVHYAAKESLFASWLAAPADFQCPLEHERELAQDILRFAHDYLHSWAYRLLGHLRPGLRTSTPVTAHQLEEQAFFFVLTESVAVVGSDYWYLSLGGLRQRCGTGFDLGPCTVHYREKLLPVYRRSNSALVVQDPAFFERIMKLYCTGRFEGFSEADLLDNRPLADWLVRELLIAPRQRVGTRCWLAHMAGISLTKAVIEARFDALVEQHAALIAEIGKWLWQKVKDGRYLFLPIPPEQGHWEYSPGCPVDYRFANANHVGTREIDWTRGGLKCWSYFVDQVVVARRLPQERARRDDIAAKLADIRGDVDPVRLQALVSRLEPVVGDDPAPLELLFVN